jgi:hypothetical protein
MPSHDGLGSKSILEPRYENRAVNDQVESLDRVAMSPVLREAYKRCPSLVRADFPAIATGSKPRQLRGFMDEKGYLGR